MEHPPSILEASKGRHLRNIGSFHELGIPFRGSVLVCKCFFLRLLLYGNYYKGRSGVCQISHHFGYPNQCSLLGFRTKVMQDFFNTGRALGGPSLSCCLMEVLPLALRSELAKTGHILDKLPFWTKAKPFEIGTCTSQFT